MKKSAPTKKQNEALRAAWAAYQEANPGMTQDRMAAKLGISQAMFSHWLTGRKPVSLGNLIALGKLLDRRPADLAPQVIAEFERQAAAMEFARTSPPMNDLTEAEKALIARVRNLNATSGASRDFSKMAIALLEALAAEGDEPPEVTPAPKQRR